MVVFSLTLVLGLALLLYPSNAEFEQPPNNGTNALAPTYSNGSTVSFEWQDDGWQRITLSLWNYCDDGIVWAQGTPYQQYQNLLSKIQQAAFIS